MARTPRLSTSPKTRAVRRREASADELREWSSAVQFAFIEALPIVTGWNAEQVVFHGGTSLSMVWGSPRYSEDLDFLLNHEQADLEKLEALLRRVLARMRQSLLLTHPGLEVELHNKTRADGRLIHFRLVASRPEVLQRAMVKTEFWPVSKEYLRGIETEQAFPSRLGSVVTRSMSEVPAVTMQAALADKLTALATRPFLKWRDLFDINLLRAHNVESMPQLAERFLFHLREYSTVEGLPARDALALWLERYTVEPGRSQSIATAARDLKPWLPGPLWTAMGTEGAANLIDNASDLVRQIIDALDASTQTPAPTGRRRTRRTTQGRCP